MSEDSSGALADAQAIRLNISGELEFDMEGVAYVLRPSMDAIEAIERQTGKSLLELANDARGLRLKLPDVAVIVAETIRAWGREATATSSDVQRDAAKYTPAGVKPFIFAAGVAQVNARLAALLMGAVSGGYDPFGHGKGEWADQLAAMARKKPIPAGG